MTSDEQKTTTSMDRQQAEDGDLSGTCNETDVVIDKSKFDVPFHVLALRVPKQHSNAVAKILSRHLFDKPRVRRIVVDPSTDDTRLIILSEKIRDSSLSELPEDKLETVRSITKVEVVQHSFVLGYDYWPVDYILKEVLPAGLEVPSSFETIGHIAHLNIRDELIPYKKLIARVILDKNQPKLRTILNKVGTITNEFRVPTFELLAGDKSFITEVKQHGATFRLDYGLVYWNSRLEFEHRRLVSLFQPKQVVCDMFAGIGPFAIPAAQKGCAVYANDLNPDSVDYLHINADLNRVTGKICIYNMDARRFMQELVIRRKKPVSDESSSVFDENEGALNAELLAGSQEEDGRARKKGKKMQQSPAVMEEGKPWEHIDHIVMNLPASALEFLDVFDGLLSAATWKGSMPRVHCYCFMRANETEKDIIELAEKALNGRIRNPNVVEVRDVAPNKRMLCLSFNLPEEVGFGKCKTTNSIEKQFSWSRTTMAGIEKNPRLET